MPNVKTCYLGGVMTDELARAIGGLEQLQTLGIGAVSVTDAQLSAVARAPRLSYLRVGGKSLTADGLRGLARSSSLSRLWIEDAVLDNLNALQDLSALESLRLDRCDVGTVDIGSSVSLQGLDVREGKIRELTARGSGQLRQLNLSTCDIQRLTVESCPRFHYLFCGSDTAIEHVRLHDLRALISITIQEGSAPGTLDLGELPALEAVTFWAADVQTRHVQALAVLPSLRRLDISSTGLGDEAAAAAGRLTTLEELSASGSFSRTGLEHLTGLPSLRKLHLYHIQQSDWTPARARRLFSHVKEVAVF